MARILVVDDSAVMRRNLMSCLKKAGHEVVAQAINGGQAYSLYKTHLPDLVTMDITMPEVNGIEAVKMIRKDFPDAKIIMISALDQKQMVFEALQHGAKHYIIKPINPEAVISVINKVLGITQTIPVEESKPKVENTGADPNQTIAEPEPKSPFTIQNKNSMFYIKITKLFTEESLDSLKQATQGLLYIQPLKVLIDFGSIEALKDTIIMEIGTIVKLIKDANGSVKITTENEKLADLLLKKPEFSELMLMSKNQI